MTSPDAPIIIDIFCGGGGASSAIKLSTGRDPDVAVNHDPKAVAMHRANHPGTQHVCQDIWACPPQWAARGRRVALLHASPDCTHHSKAKGGPPNRDEKRRDLPWTIIKWARELLPNLITMENVEEIQSWGPCDKSGVPIKSQAGASFRSFVAALRRLGYAVKWGELRACDYGAPTIRKRLFLIARRDGKPIVWPAPTHGPGRAQPHRTAAECIDWRIPCPSIFDRPRPLAENTLHRIAEGIKRYVVGAAEPFIVTYYGPKKTGEFRGCGMGDLLGTQTTENRHGLVAPVLVTNTSGHAPGDVNTPMSTLTTGQQQVLVAPVLVGAGGPVYSGKPAPADRPMNTLMTENHTAIAGAFLAKHYGGVVGHGLEQPIGSVTTVDHHSLVAASMVKLRGTNVGSPAAEPMHTISAQGQHHGLVVAHLQRDFGHSVGQAADAPLGTVTAGGGGKAGVVYSFLQKYYGEGSQHSSPGEPMHTITTKDRMAVVEARQGGGNAHLVRALLRWHRADKLSWAGRCDDFDGLLEDAFCGQVVLGGEVLVIADIGMRMCQPRELYLVQGFPPDYIIGDDPAQGLALTKAERVFMCGNSVSPPPLKAILDANYTEDFATGLQGRALPLLAGEV